MTTIVCSIIAIQVIVDLTALLVIRKDRKK